MSSRTWRRRLADGGRLARRCVLHCLPVDIVALLYACWIYHVRFPGLVAADDSDLYALYGLCVAKCHGLAASLVFLVAALHRCQSLKRCAGLMTAATVADRRCLSALLRRLSPRSPLQRDRGNTHVIDGSRWLVSGLLHALIHVTMTHPLSALPAFSAAEVDETLSGRLVELLRFVYAHYRWTVSGYLLAILAVVIVVAGRRLLAFARWHTVWRNVHVSSYVCSVLAVTTHSSNYFVLALTLAVLLAETVCTLVLAERVRLTKVEVLRGTSNGATADEDMVELQFTSRRFSRRFRCGDYVRLYAPSLAWFETHSFTVVPHHRKPNTYRAFVRATGRWTGRLARAAPTLERLYVLGPYANDGEVSLERLLYVSPEQLEAGERPFYFVDGAWSLNLVCTGIAITRHLAVLAHLVACYGDRPCCAVRNHANMRLPGRLRLIWMVRKSFDVNLAIAMLNDMQRRLEASDWPSLLGYDIFVSREPTELELVGNTRRQLEMLDRGRVYSMWEREANDGANNDQLERVLYDCARRCGELLEAKRSWRLSAADLDEHARRLRNFYRAANLRVGARAENWRRLLHGAGDRDDDYALSVERNEAGAAAATAVDDDDETLSLSRAVSQSQPAYLSTTTVLTTAIRSVAEELRRLHDSSCRDDRSAGGDDALYVESLW